MKINEDMLPNIISANKIQILLNDGNSYTLTQTVQNKPWVTIPYCSSIDNPTGWNDPRLLRQSFIGTIYLSGNWYFCITIVHRNEWAGEGYTWQIRKRMTSSNITVWAPSFEWRQCSNGTWTSWYQIKGTELT